MRYKITTIKHTSPTSYYLFANSINDAHKKATQKDGIAPISIQEAGFALPIPQKEVLLSLKQFALMQSSNLSISNIFQSLCKNTHNQRLSNIFSSIYSSLENGLGLYECFLPYEGIFGKFTLVMIKIGTKSGKLKECLELLISQLDYQEKIKKEIQKALFYPCFVLIVSLVCFFFLLIFVVPQFVELFTQNQLNLPIYTKILIFLYEGSIHYGWIALVFLCFFMLFLIFQIRNKGKLYQSILSISLMFPVFGKMILYSYLQRYCFTLSILLQSGIDLFNATSIAQSGIQSIRIQNKLEKIKHALLNGKTLTEGMQESGIFDFFTLNLIQTAQQSGKLEEVLKLCAKEYQSRFQSQIQIIISLIEPCFTLLLGIFVLFLALGIFVPIWNLNG